jgi:2-keto-4-pentenoate hydratase/2-oxohepta-3-ene-1,7-dioic acid hydratase in catechol pathway
MRPHVSDSLDYEAELAIVIGKHARYIDECHAMEYVGGYTCLAENSVREYQRHGTQVTPGKNFDRSGAIGPWIVTADEVPRPTNLRLRGKLNGETVQSARVSELLFTIPQLIAYASSFTTLRPGDVIATGTPDGVGAARTPPRFLRCGDVFEVEVEGVGLLRNRVAEEETMSAAHVRETVGAR